MKFMGLFSVLTFLQKYPNFQIVAQGLFSGKSIKHLSQAINQISMSSSVTNCIVQVNFYLVWTEKMLSPVVEIHAIQREAACDETNYCGTS